MHVVDRVSSNFAAILMPVGIGLGIMQHGLVSSKTPAADMLTINLLQRHFTHNHPHRGHRNLTSKWASRCCVSGRTTAGPEGHTNKRIVKHLSLQYSRRKRDWR